jgi:hypothetical protein
MRGVGLGGSSERRACENCGSFVQGKRLGTTQMLEERGVGEVGVWVWGLIQARFSLRD